MNSGLNRKSDMILVKPTRSRFDTTLFSIIFVCLISISLTQISYAQDSPILEEQITLSGNLLNDPIAQDLLKKIEQTKKMIKDLEEKTYEQNQAQENLQKMRDMSLERLNHDLEEWERVWEKHSSKNSFERFVNKKPGYVQGVFWDQFEFKEQKVNAGRTAMNKVLITGGTMYDAIEAYNRAASTQKIELIEMNSQFNVRHNLANHAEQQLFNSTGQVHLSPATHEKLSDFYADYKLQPTYIMANSNDLDISSLISNVDANKQCGEGMKKIDNLISGSQTCIDESIARQWTDMSVKGIVIHDDKLDKNLTSSGAQTNPGTKCQEEHMVIYDVLASVYRCVLESTAQDMVSTNTAEIHSISEYALNKDAQKIIKDTIYEINQEVLLVTEEYEIRIQVLDSRYDDLIENKGFLAKQAMQEIIEEYKNSSMTTKEDVTKNILQIRDANDSLKEKIIQEQSDAIHVLELELKNKILEIVQGYENHPDIDVDWDYLSDMHDVVYVYDEDDNDDASSNTSSLEQKTGKLHLKNAGIVNSFGEKFDEIKSNQILQVAADIINPDEHTLNFVYSVEITDSDDVLVQPAKWITGRLDPNQTLNVGLSWIPGKDGIFNATISVGTAVNSVVPMADIEIDVNAEGNISDEDYCKNGHDLLFKYSDNSPICATPETASKLINTGLAFA